MCDPCCPIPDCCMPCGPCCPPTCPPRVRRAWKRSQLKGTEIPHSSLSLLQRCPSRELKGSVLLTSCECVKRNGLQLDCPRSECHGRPLCSTNPIPSCCPSKYTWRYTNVTMGKPTFTAPKPQRCQPQCCDPCCFDPCCMCKFSLGLAWRKISCDIQHFRFQKAKLLRWRLASDRKKICKWKMLATESDWLKPKKKLMNRIRVAFSISPLTE